MDNQDVTVDPTTVTKSNVVTSIQLSVPQFFLNATEMDVYVTLYAENRTFVESRMIHIPPDVYAQWGSDDDYIVDYVLSQLGIHRPPLATDGEEQGTT